MEGDSAVELHMSTEQLLQPKDERINSINPSPDTSISRGSRSLKDQRATSETSVSVTTMYPFNAYTPQEQGFRYGGYGNGTVNLAEDSNYVNSNNLHVLPMAMYNDNQSLYFPSGYGFDSQMAYGQFSPLANPLSPIMVDNHLFSPHQIPISPSYYPPPVSPGLPHANSMFSVAQSELVPSASGGQDNLNENAAFGPGSGYYLPYGSIGGDISGSSGVGLYKFSSEFGSGEPFPNHSSALETSRFLSPLTSGNVYPHPMGMGILGPYEQNVTQTPLQGYGLMSNSSAQHYPHVGPYQVTGGSDSYRHRFGTDKGRRYEGDRDSAGISADLLSFSTDRNRGPRASKTREPGEGSSSRTKKEVNSTPAFHVDRFNSPDFITDYDKAKFFVIKSFSEDNIHKSIKYGIWASTPLGNRKLDAACHEAKEMEGACPVFLFFSVNGSGQFCGVAEMVGPVDFENNAEYWQQDRWSGQFPVKWHIIKDVPNSQFRHILLENNDNKPVTHSRDSQEVKLEQGLEILRIFKNHDADTSLLDDFNFYDEREKSLLERKAKQRASETGNTSSLSAESINQLSSNLANALGLDGVKTSPHTELE